MYTITILATFRVTIFDFFHPGPQPNNQKLQTNPWHRKEEQHNKYNAHDEKLTKATSSSLPIKMIAKPEWTQSNAPQNTEQ